MRTIEHKKLRSYHFETASEKLEFLFFQICCKLLTAPASYLYTPSTSCLVFEADDLHGTALLHTPVTIECLCSAMLNHPMVHCKDYIEVLLLW